MDSKQAVEQPVGEARWLAAAGRRLHARWIGSPHDGGPERPTLVFMHHALGSVAQWRDVPAALAAATGCPALVYERAGHGTSGPASLPRTRRYLHDEAEVVLPAVLEAAGVTSPLLVGHSDGATIALLYAARFPSRPRAIIAEAAHLFVEPEGLAGIRAAVEAYETADLRTRLERYHGAGVDDVFYAWSDTWSAPWFRDWDITAAMPAVRCPVLVVQGTADEYGTQAQVDAIADNVSGPVEVVMPACGHIPHHEARAEVLAAMTDFVRRVIDGATAPTRDT